MVGADLDLLKSFIPEKSAPKTQDHLETKVILRDVKLATIRRIRMDGDTWDVVADGGVPMDADAPATPTTADEPATV